MLSCVRHVRANYTGLISVFPLEFVQIFTHVTILIKKYTSNMSLVNNIHTINVYLEVMSGCVSSKELNRFHQNVLWVGG
jgi:hypothetical protein